MSDLNPANMNMPGCSSTNPILIAVSPPPLMAIGKRHAFKNLAQFSLYTGCV